MLGTVTARLWADCHQAGRGDLSGKWVSDSGGGLLRRGLGTSGKRPGEAGPGPLRQLEGWNDGEKMWTFSLCRERPHGLQTMRTWAMLGAWGAHSGQASGLSVGGCVFGKEAGK